MKLKTACNRDCPDACAMLATVEDGRVVRLQGDPEHPVTRGFLCYRTNRFLDRQYDPERLTEPLMRVNDELKPVSWQAALDRIAETMLRIRQESGPAAILHYRSGGAMGLMKHVSDLFFERFGPVTIKSGDICSGAGEAAQELDFGDVDSSDLFDLLNARTILLWGKNPYVGNVHLLPVLKEARERGARIVLIDPVRHKSALLADHVLQPRPGGDAALALGVARLLFESGRTDPDAPDYCDHFDAFRGIAMSRSSDEWAALADVSVKQVQTLTDLYADGPSTILVGWGMQRRTHGAMTIRVLDALGAVSGQIGRPGTGVSFYFKRRGPFDLSFSKGLAIAPRSIPEPLLGPGIVSADDPPVRMVWVTAGNPVAMLPESETVAEALRSRELTVVVDSHPTDTVRCADIVLPTTTMLEDDDLVGAYGHHWLNEVRPVVDAPSAVKTDYAILSALAPRLGLGEEFSLPVESWKERLIGKEKLEAIRSGPFKPASSADVIFAGRRFATPNGKANLIASLDPEPPRPTADRPLLLTALAHERSQSSQWPAETQVGPATATIHPDAANGCAEGDTVLLESETGSMEVRLRFDADQRRDVVILPKGGWLSAGRAANALIPAKASDLGGCAVYHDTPVRLLVR